MCRVVDTVLIDQETIYALRNGNDRLLLGLKGSLNEYELDLLRQRSLSGTARFAKRSTDERSRGAKMPIIVRSIFFAIGLLFAAVTGIGQSSHPSHQANSDGMSPYPYPGDFVFSWYA